MTKIFHLYYTSILKVYRNHVNVSSPVKRSMGMGVAPDIQPPTLAGPPQLSTRSVANPSNNSCFSYGNPCLDFFFNVRLDHPYAWPSLVLGDDPKPQYSHEYLKQLLPQAWSHDPLTTLKLIFNLLDTEVSHETGKNDKQGFYAAAYWLYQNHPKTLACNVAPIAESFGRIADLLETLYRTLEGEDVRRRRKQKANALDQEIHTGIRGRTSSALDQEINTGIRGRTSSGRRREKIFALANKAIERYQRDPNYRFFHDRVSDLFAQCIKYDIHIFNKQHQIDDENDEPKRLELTQAGYHCPRVDSSYDRATLLCESIAKKLFPRESEDEEEADYTRRVREKLKKEVLVPLRKPLEDWRVYHNAGNREPCAVKMYLEEVKTGGKSKIKAGALLPNEIVRYMDDADVGQAAELQWKTMVEDIYLKQGKFKNCLVACDITGTRVSGNVSVALALLASQLSEDPWKGKMISFSSCSKPELHSIQGEGDDDLKSKCEFVRELDFGEDCDANLILQKVFDLILQVAVDANLKPEQLLKKVLVITHGYQRFHEDGCWESDYEAIQSKFKEKGYAVPQIVIWKLSHHGLMCRPVRSTKQMVGIITGVSNNLFQTFLDNDGEIDPDHVMEAAICGKKYQNLIVVD